jgi:hypothetical protein
MLLNNENEPPLTITKINEWEDKPATYDLIAENIRRYNISENKLTESAVI